MIKLKRRLHGMQQEEDQAQFFLEMFQTDNTNEIKSSVHSIDNNMKSKQGRSPAAKNK